MAYFNLICARSRTLLRLASLALFMSLSGCSIIPSAPVLQVYLLPIASPADEIQKGQPIDWSLRIAQPSSSQFLNSSRIAVQPQGEEITVYKDSRWSDPVPILLRNRLIQEFRTEGRMQAVSSDDDGLQADFELGGDLTAFQGVYQGSKGEVLIRFDARLVRTADRRIIASHSFEVHQPITGKSMDGVVQAFGLANDQLATQVLNWTLQQVPAK